VVTGRDVVTGGDEVTAFEVAATPTEITRSEVLAALGSIPDPELPAIGLVDLGVVRSVEVAEHRIVVELIPTFLGCPALELMCAAVRDRLATLAPDRAIDVRVSHAEPWSSDRISSTGRAALRRSGIGPPLPAATPIEVDVPVPCPYCGSSRTVLENAFGPTLCRQIRYCTACRQPFEQVKVL